MNFMRGTMSWMQLLCGCVLLWLAPSLTAHAQSISTSDCWYWEYLSNGQHSFNGPLNCTFSLQGGIGGPGVVIPRRPEGGDGPERDNPGNPNGKKDPAQDPCNTAGNPIVYSTGNKIEPETDFESGSPMGLSLHRTYNNYWDGIGIFGKNWLSDYDYK